MRANTLSPAVMETDELTVGSDSITDLNPNRGKNLIINGDFDFWQRGTSFSSTGYYADRWKSNNLSSATYTVSRQSFTTGQTDVPDEPTYFFRIAVTVGGGSPRGIEQRIENVRTAAGKTVTLSFWAKADATRTMRLLLWQGFGSGGSGNVTLTEQNPSINTSWQKITATFDVPSISGKTIGVGSFLAASIQLDDISSGTLDLSHVQLELGSEATDFEILSRQQTREKCLRYFQSITFGGTYRGLGSIRCSQSGAIMAFGFRSFPMSMRVAPTATETNNGQVNYVKTDTQALTNGVAGGLYAECRTDGYTLKENIAGTNGHSYVGVCNSPVPVLEFDAEL